MAGLILVIVGQVTGFAGYARSGQVTKVRLVVSVGRDGSTSTATRYGSDSPLIESVGRGQGFPHPCSPALGLTQSSIKWALSHGYSSRGVALTTTPSSLEVKERVGLYLCSPCGLHSLFQGDLYLYFTLGWSIYIGQVSQKFIYLCVYIYYLFIVRRYSHSHSLLPTCGYLVGDSNEAFVFRQDV